MKVKLKDRTIGSHKLHKDLYTKSLSYSNRKIR